MFKELREKYNAFIFDRYEVTEDNDFIHAEYHYVIGEFNFTSNIKISKLYISNKNINKKFLDYLLFNFGMMDMINYYKLTCSEKIIVNCGSLNDKQIEFYKKLMFNGLGEYFYINRIDLAYDEFVTFEVKNKNFKKHIINEQFGGNLIPIGGGKDSIVTLLLLKDYKDNNICFHYNRNIYPRNEAAYNTIYLAGYKDMVTFDLTFDPLMLKLSKEYLNGHVPISSHIAMAAYIMAYLNNKEYVVLSNESSANVGNVMNTYINHQYSKSFEFENDFRNYCDEFLTSDIKYFSLLRPWNEYKIVEYFSLHKEYLDVFRSCNVGTKKNVWCSDCAKCLYVYIMLFPFLTINELDKIFNNRMLDENKYKDIFDSLIRDDLNKPFECVGEKDEINYALSLSVKKYKELPKLLEYYKDNYYDEKRKYKVDNYFNNNNLIPEEYLSLLSDMKTNIVSFLRNKKILILGFAREGFSTYKFIRSFDSNLRIGIADIKEIDINSYEELKKDVNIDYYFGNNYLDAIKEYDIVIKAPGVVLKDYEETDNLVKITSQTDLFLRYTQNKVIGVTGTKGKSTTSSLIYHVLKELGKDAVLVGNIGFPCFDSIDLLKKDTIVVYEMSCHQLENVKASPYIAVLLNIFEDHLDHYIDYDIYVNVKKNIYKFQKKDNYLVCNDQIPIMSKDSSVIRVSFDDIDKYNIETNLRGRHNLFNIIVCIKVCELLYISSKETLRCIKNFSGLSHRLEYVGNFNGINFINDSISTTVESTISGINSFDKVDTIIIGGMDRGIDYRPLASFINESTIDNVILLPDTALKIEKFFNEINSKKNIIMVKTMQEAVIKAKELTPKNGICLLSPAAASYNMYKNFEERGNDYKRLVSGSY